MSRVVTGIDPGGAFTGVVSVRGGGSQPQVVAVDVVPRNDQSLAAYLAQVHAVIETHRLLGVKLLGDQRGQGSWLLAMESLEPPRGHLGMISVRGLLDCSAVIGAVLATYNDVVMISPAKNGSSPLTCYPAELRGVRERQGAGVLRHARSAYDVAVAAPLAKRLAAAEYAVSAKV